MDRVSIETDRLSVVVIVSSECILHELQCSRIIRFRVAIGVIAIM